MQSEKLTELLHQYFELGVAEGREGRNHDTEAGDAQRVLSEIEAEIAALSTDAEPVIMDDEDRTPMPIGFDEALWRKADEVHHAMSLVARDQECVKIIYGALSTDAEPVAIYKGNGLVDCGESGHHNIELLKLIPANTPLYAEPVKTAPAVAVKALQSIANYRHHSRLDSEENAEAMERIARSALSAQVQDVAETLETYYQRQIEWSRETFGSALRTKGIIDHIKKELREIEADPHDLSEWVDVVILAMDGFWRHGGNAEDLFKALTAKQQKNMARTWPDWRTMSEDSAIEHDRSKDAAPPNGGQGVMKVKIKGKISTDPRDRVLAIEAVTKSICQMHGMDPAEGVMMLLTAAAHITSVHSRKPASENVLALASSLGHATVAADGFFKLRPVTKNPQKLEGK